MLSIKLFRDVGLLVHGVRTNQTLNRLIEREKNQGRSRNSKNRETEVNFVFLIRLFCLSHSISFISLSFPSLWLSCQKWKREEKRDRKTVCLRLLTLFHFLLPYSPFIMFCLHVSMGSEAVVVGLVRVRGVMLAGEKRLRFHLTDTKRCGETSGDTCRIRLLFSRIFRRGDEWWLWASPLYP